MELQVRNWDVGNDADNNNHKTSNGPGLDHLDPDTRDISALSDSYRREGKLGAIISKRFVEHDTFCMFDNLMGGAEVFLTWRVFTLL